VGAGPRILIQFGFFRAEEQFLQVCIDDARHGMDCVANDFNLSAAIANCFR